VTVSVLFFQAQNNDDFFGSFRDFFDSQAWLLFRNISLFFVAIFYVASVFWVYKDARRRIEDPWLLAMAVALGAFPPFIGPLLYMLFRPPEYLEDVRERELEIKAMEESLDYAERCPVCRAAVEPTFLSCPVCTSKLRQACRSCNSPLEPLWQICPFCETPVEVAPEGAPVLGPETPLRGPESPPQDTAPIESPRAVENL
jgi:double zinc ribbon protein